MGARMEESKAINKSLFNLQACLKELRWNQQNAAEREPRNVPYRASKVTNYAGDAARGGLVQSMSQGSQRQRSCRCMGEGSTEPSRFELAQFAVVLLLMAAG